MNPIPFLFYAPYRQNLTGGPREFLNLLEQLQGTEILPICVAHQHSPLTQQLQQQGFETVIVPFPAILDVYNEGVFAYSAIDKLRSLKALWQYNQQIAQVGQRYQVQGVWGRNVKSVLLIGLAARQLGVPLIWDIGMEKESRGLVKLLHWLGLSLATTIVTQATAQPGEIFDPIALKLFGAKFVTIRPGTGLDRIATVPLQTSDRFRTQENFNILMVGTIQPRKNQRMLLEAIKPLVKYHPQIRVSIVGPATDEAYLQSCQQFVEAENLAAHVAFLGWRDDVPDLMQQSDLFVLCSTNEGVPYVIREAMHARLPIIATAVGGVPEAIEAGQTGFLVEKDDGSGLQKLIEYCLTHPEECQAIGKRAREAAMQAFSLANWSSQYNDLLLKVCQV